ncbi:MAG TPA: class I tRNA ligase family protein, partial [Aquaticitalea sp.]|nr:class I tRNA ligase family protein [Aquaticitalea sp.]
EAALALAKSKSGNPNLSLDNLTQDKDALDTWFSSWLWPISVFDGIRNPDNLEIKYYYPTNDLVTGPDILFFWVARMIIAGYEYRDQKPFENVYLTGLVRDKHRRKMSKSLGNSPDALKLIDDYGADGVRVGLLLSSAAGNDLMFDEELCKQGKAFANKIWNAFRLIKGWEVADIEQPQAAKAALEWYRAKFLKTLSEIEDHYSKFRLSDALMAIYKLIWDDFCSWLLEITKPDYQQPIDSVTFNDTIKILESNLKLLHPFMPFLTEEIWQHIVVRKPEEALIVANYPKTEAFDEAIINDFENIKEVVAGIRSLRKEKSIAFREPIALSVLDNEHLSGKFDAVITKLGNVSEISLVSKSLDGAMSFRVKSNEYFVPVSGNVNIEEELKKLNDELKYTEGFLRSVQGKLSNERFVNNAPEQVLQNERKKEADALAKIVTLKASLANLSQ